MNWTASDITDTKFLPCEHDVLGKTSNAYGTFIRVAFAVYPPLSVEEKEDIIEKIMVMRMYITGLSLNCE